MAYQDFGVWALVSQYLSNTVINTCILALVLRWRPRPHFSKKRAMDLFKYGWKLLVTDLINTLYSNLRDLLIGRVYSTIDLGFYTRGKQFPNLIVNNINSSINSVLFPALSKLQDNKQSIKYAMRRSMKTSAFCIFPLLVGMIIVGDNLIATVLTDKWKDSVVYLQVFCLVYMTHPIRTANNQALKAIGRSDICLRLEIANITVGLVSILVSIRISVLVIAFSELFASLFDFFLLAFINRKVLRYGLKEQMSDIGSSLLLSLSMGIVVYLIGYLPIKDLPLLIIQVVIGSIVYVIASYVTKSDSLFYILDILVKYINNLKLVGKRFLFNDLPDN